MTIWSRPFSLTSSVNSERILYATKANKNEFHIGSGKNYSILDVAKMFKTKIKYLPRRPGERYASALTNMNLSNKVYKYFGKIDLKEYIKEFLKKN